MLILQHLLNGLLSGAYYLLIALGLSLIFALGGIVNLAHGAFYAIGAYLAVTIGQHLGFTGAALVSPVVVGLLGAAFERTALRRVHKFGHVPELLITFGLSYVILELVKLVWGLSSAPFSPPLLLQGPAFTIIQSSADGLGLAWGVAPEARCTAAAGASVTCSTFPATRFFMMMVALVMLLALWLMLTRTRIGLVIQASLTHPEMAESLGHNVPLVFMLVFGSGCALAGLAGVVGGMTFVTEPSMAAILGSIIFVVVVVGGMGSLAGAFVGSLIVGLLQTLPLTVDKSLVDLVSKFGWKVVQGDLAYPIMKITLAQAAPILPYLLLVLMLIFRPRGVMGTREG